MWIHHSPEFYQTKPQYFPPNQPISEAFDVHEVPHHLKKAGSGFKTITNNLKATIAMSELLIQADEKNMLTGFEKFKKLGERSLSEKSYLYAWRLLRNYSTEERAQIF